MAAHYDLGHTLFPSGKTPKEGGNTLYPKLPSQIFHPSSRTARMPEAEHDPSRGDVRPAIAVRHRSPQIPALRDRASSAIAGPG